MDLYCPRCGEPWDFDCLHEEAAARYGIPYYVPQLDPYGPASRERNPAYDADAYGIVYKDVLPPSGEWAVGPCM